MLGTVWASQDWAGAVSSSRSLTVELRRPYPEEVSRKRQAQ